MTAESIEHRAQLGVKARIFFVSAGMLLAIPLLRFLLSFTVDPRLVLVQLAWSASFVLLGVAVGSGRMAPWLSGCMAGLVCMASVATIIHYTGGLASPYFVALIAIPLLIAMFSPDSRRPTLVALGAMLLSMTVLNVLAGVPPRTFLPHLAVFGFIGSIGLYAGRTYRQLGEAEKRAQQERLSALEQLAESERLRRRVERERAEVERLVIVGQLASGVAHEVNNPLAFVKSNLHYLEQELLGAEGTPPGPDELREVLGETKHGVLRIQQIVSDLRRFSREGSADTEQGSPTEAMEEAWRLASVRLRGLGEVTLEVYPGLPRVELGQRQLVQVLLNLLLNAADAVESALPARKAHIVLRARRTPGGVRLEVEDNGPGIPPEVMPRLFEPFFTTKPPGKGTGLGLALCREYVSRSGGSLSVENRTEGGARFILTLNETTEAASAA